MEYGDDWLGCGVATHDPDCLCDVHITHPLPPLTECLRDGVQDMWMGRQLAALKDYGRPWTNESILNYLTDLETFYDAFHEQPTYNIGAIALCEVPVLDLPDDIPLPARWKLIRDSVQFCIDSFSEPLVVIVRHLDVTPQDVVDAMTTCKGGDGWDENRLFLLDDMMSAETVNYANIAETMDLPIGVVRGLRKYWEHRRFKTWQGASNPAQAMFHELCRNTNMGPTEIVALVKERHGVEYHRASVSKYRSRLKDRQ